MQFDVIDDLLRDAITHVMQKQDKEPIFIQCRLVNYDDLYEALVGEGAST
jgi:hypothetical protein